MKINDVISEEVLNHFLDETYNSINEVKKLANDIVLKIVDNNFEQLKKQGSINYLYGVYINCVDSSKYVELKDFIDKTIIYVYINDMDRPNIYGNYSMYRMKDNTYNPKIEREINVFIKDIRTLFDEINDDYKQNPNYSNRDLYLALFNNLYSTLIHEIQHAFDDYRSMNKIYQTSKYDKFLSYADKINDDKFVDKLEQQKDNDIAKEMQQSLRYLNLQHEVWARFSQALYRTQFTSLEFTDDEKGYYFKMKPISAVVKDFMHNFSHFRVLNDGMKRRLVNKIVQFWHYEDEKLKKEMKNNNIANANGKAKTNVAGNMNTKTNVN
ncbi:hypothetical protein M0Q97_08720 [Candidatus Dojkabacteria bacterium]|jgi:hypothetical protein|nr:hypothetical protein [Candidatus Dojkabacteria bacterium]